VDSQRVGSNARAPRRPRRSRRGPVRAGCRRADAVSLAEGRLSSFGISLGRRHQPSSSGHRLGRPGRRAPPQPRYPV